MSDKIKKIQIGTTSYDIEPAISSTLQVDNAAPTLAWNTTSVVGTVDGTDLTVKLPANPNTDTKVTAVGNHYTPAADTSAELTAAISGTAGAYAKDTEYTVLTGVKAQRDAKGHVTGITYTAQKIKDTNTTYTIPTVNNAALTLNVGGQAVSGNNTFTANDATATTYNVPSATASAYGVIKVSSVNSSAVTVNSESTTAGRYYPVELNSDGKAIVNVPWTDTDTNTDTKVTQTQVSSSTYDKNYPLWMAGNDVATTTSQTTTTLKNYNKLYANPYHGYLTATSVLTSNKVQVYDAEYNSGATLGVGLGGWDEEGTISIKNDSSEVIITGAGKIYWTDSDDNDYTINFPTDNGTLALIEDLPGVVGANGTTGLIKNGSTVTSTSGLTACPIIGGVPYYKDTNTNSASAADNILDGSNSGTTITYAPYTSQQSKLSFDTSTTNPTRTDRLNINGYLYGTKLYSGGKEVLTSHQDISGKVNSHNGSMTGSLEIWDSINEYGYINLGFGYDDYDEEGCVKLTHSDSDNYTTYAITGISHKVNSTEYAYSFPTKTGTLALTSDIKSLVSNTTASGGIKYITEASFTNGVLTLESKYLHLS